MKGRTLLLLVSMTVSAMSFGAANGAWLKKVPQADRDRVNPYAGNAQAVAAGKNLLRTIAPSATVKMLRAKVQGQA